MKELITRTELSKRAMVSCATVTRACKDILKPALVGNKLDAGSIEVKAFITDSEDKKNNNPLIGIDELYDDAVIYCNKVGKFKPSNISRGLHIGLPRAKRIFKQMEASGTAVPINTESTLNGSKKALYTKKSAALANLNNDAVTNDNEIPEDITKFADMTLRQLIRRFGTDTAFLDWLKSVKMIEDVNEKRLKNAVTQGELIKRDVIKNGVIDPIDTALKQLLTDGSKTIAIRVSSMRGAGLSVDECSIFVSDQISSFIKPMKARIARTLKNA